MFRFQVNWWVFSVLMLRNCFIFFSLVFFLDAFKFDYHIGYPDMG
jgi:hypothetical protein